MGRLEAGRSQRLRAFESRTPGSVSGSGTNLQGGGNRTGGESESEKRPTKVWGVYVSLIQSRELQRAEGKG